MAYKYGEKITRTYNGTKRTWRSFIKYETNTTADKVEYEVSVGVENCSSSSMAFDAKKLTTTRYIDSSTKSSTNSSKLSLNGDTKKTIISSYSGSFTRGDTEETHTLKGKNVAASSCAWHGTSTASVTIKVPAVGMPDVRSLVERDGQNIVQEIVVQPTTTDVKIDALDGGSVEYAQIITYTEDGEPDTTGTPFTTTGGFTVQVEKLYITEWFSDLTMQELIRKTTQVVKEEETTLPITVPAETVSYGRMNPLIERITTISTATVKRTCNADAFTVRPAEYVARTSLTFNNGAISAEEETIIPRALEQEWEMEFEGQGSTYPETDQDGNAREISVYAFPYVNGAFSNTPDLIDGTYKLVKGEIDETDPDNPIYHWSIHVTLDKTYVDDEFSETPNAIIQVFWDNPVYSVPDGMRAIFQTTKNMNYANGLANSVFVGGCREKNYTSRVWYSKVNEPLYFPDTNYMEVGSNDTAVFGLTKVGDYLCIIKQGKTTDTSIYLAYPTSFEDDTAYAVKQGLNGVGADSRFSFNIMNEEALFLSDIGVMAIVPTETEEKRIQNRSYFIDRKLAEEDHSLAYSFVFENKYFLAFQDTGHCYVLDGNQRNSWGNDKTNLVYECYYLEDIYANNFMKFKHELWFSTGSNICRFKGDDDEYPYQDGVYEEEDGETVWNGTPVIGEWSTLFDDDGSIHYYKTMQKKGNVVSILPSDYKYTLVELTEEEWNADRTKYFELTEDGYERCSYDSIYNGGTYYIRDVSATKVYVRKDANEPIEIQRKFNERSHIPSEMILKKKFKKYKRLQFIVRNEEDEPFGVDEIIKSYTVGNYSKK